MIILLGKEITSLEYKGEELEQLADPDIQVLAQALKNPNCKFNGPLDLSDNVQLTDLSALYISEIFSRPLGLKELNLSGNIMMESKAGLFIGDALLKNPSFPIYRLTFKNVNLEESGLYRLLEAANECKTITRLHVGIVSDYGLRTMGELLKANRNLLRLQF